jgi:hypothetical protein
MHLRNFINNYKFLLLTHTLLKPILTICFLLIQLTTYAQNSSITGRVIGSNGLGIEGVSISLENSKKGTVTDQEGFFTISSIREKEPVMHISSIGYFTQKIRIKVSDNQVSHFTITLKEY